MTDSNDVKLTEREAVSNDGVRRKNAILRWQVIDRLSRSCGDATGIEGPDTTCTVASPDQGTTFVPVEGYA